MSIQTTAFQCFLKFTSVGVLATTAWDKINSYILKRA